MHLTFFQTLQSMTPVVKDDDCASGLQPENQDKNRDPKILPGKLTNLTCLNISNF